MRFFAVQAAILAIFAAAGCEKATFVDTGLAPDDGCSVDPEHFIGASIVSTGVATVLEARWTTDEPSVGRVIAEVEDVRWTTPPEVAPVTEHSLALVGSPARTDVRVRLVSDVDGELRCSQTFDVTTPAPPPELPELAVDPDYAGHEPSGWTLVPMGALDTSIPVAIDSLGRYCWWWQGDGYFFYTEIGPDGGLLLLDSPATLEGDGRLLELGFDGTVQREVVVPTAHNQAVATPDGSVYLLGREHYSIEYDGEPVQMASDTVIELQPDGTQAQIWSARETVYDALWPMIEQQVLQGRAGVLDWSHGTSIAYNELHDQLQVVLTGSNSVLGLERSTGELAWVLGGEAATIDGSSELGGMVSVPHSVQALGDRVLLYNQRAFRDSRECGEAVEVALDLPSDSSELVWWAREPDCTSPDTMGSAYRMDDGTTLVAGGSLGRMGWFDDQGELVWRITGELGTTFGGASHVDALR